ncbi:PREDICTED: methyltransferase-like protein 24 [Calidris pugnax]|uniref:methyltransferase-like protein 24 n=1 Tax=Calidris pugnax TaxID=198806 RepID=UPI00071C6C54|nr:PREDICTED: methyltransferase-like protein 24 [Calidris pugnax]
MERIILKDMSKHTEDGEVVGDSQRAFTRGKLCLTSLMALYDGVTASMDKGGATDVICIDFYSVSSVLSISQLPSPPAGVWSLAVRTAGVFLHSQLSLGVDQLIASEAKCGRSGGIVHCRSRSVSSAGEAVCQRIPAVTVLLFSWRRRPVLSGGSAPPLSHLPPSSPTVRWHIELQPWASPTPSLNYEALRFLKYISTSQISCEHMNLNSLRGHPETAKKPWSICLDERFSLIHRIRSKQCRLYSLGLGNDDNQFEISMANSGCEVHRFDPSIKSAHIHEGQHLWYHRLSIDWRDPNPAIAAHKLHSNTKKLGTILNEFGHQKIDVLKADVESAEWKILENLILEDVVEQIGQLVVEVHIHWPGFEVSGNDSTVVRYWYSLLRELELKDFRLFHTYKDLSKPQMFLKKEAFNASSCYTLSWVNTRWK